MSTLRCNGAFAGAAVFLMIAVVFNVPLAEAGGQEWDTVKDSLGYVHGVYASFEGDVYYSNNIGMTQRGAFPVWNTPVKIYDSTSHALFPRISIDDETRLFYVVWIEQSEPAVFMMTASSDCEEWTIPLAIGLASGVPGNPILGLSADSGTLSITWKQYGQFIIAADSDGDMIPDAVDVNPLEFDWASPVSGEPDLISADGSNGIVIAADVAESDGLRINIEEIAVDMPLPGWPETAFEVNILNSTGAIIHPDNCTIQLMFELSKIYTILPDHPEDIRVYRLVDDVWKIVAAWAFNETTGYFDSRGIVWAITDHLSVFSLGEYTLIDSDSDSFLDSREMDHGQYPSTTISTFASGASSATLTIPTFNSLTSSQSISLPIQIPSTTDSLVLVESAQMDLSINQPVEIVSSDSFEVSNSFIRLASLDGIPILFSLDSSNGTIEYRLNDGSGWGRPTTVGTYGPLVYYFAVGTYGQNISLVFVQQEKYYYSTSAGGDSIFAAPYYYRDIVNVIHSENGGINWTEPVALISSYRLFGGIYPSVLVSYNETLIVFDAQLYEQDGPTPPVLQLRGITVAFYANGTLSYSQVMNYTLGVSYHGIPKFDNQGDFISLVWLNDNGDGSVSLLSTEMTEFGWHWDETPDVITTFYGVVEDIFDMDRMDDSVFTAWIENDEIRISQKYSDGNWSDTVPVYNSGNPLSKPTCDILENGTTLISWWERTTVDSLMVGVVDFQGIWLMSPMVTATRDVSDTSTETLICESGDILFSWTTGTSVASVVINTDTETLVDVDGDGLTDMELTDYSATTDLVQHIRTGVTKTAAVNGSVTLPFIIISTPGTSIRINSLSLSTIAIQTDPCDVDSDNDTYTDSVDMILGGSPTPFIQSDRDGLDDRTEVLGLGINVTVGIEYQQVNIKSTPSTIPFLDDYFNPVVIVIPDVSTLPPSCYHSRITSLTNNSVTIVSELWDTSSQPEFDAMMYVAEGGAMNLPSGGMVIADEESISGVGWHHVRFVVPFIYTPTVYCSILSNYDPTPVTAQVKDITRYGFEVCLHESEVEIAAGNTHTFREIIGFIAIEQGYSFDEYITENVLFFSSGGSTIETTYPTNPSNPDDDGDGWLDVDEGNGKYKTSATNDDTDGDKIKDGFSSGTILRDKNPLKNFQIFVRMYEINAFDTADVFASNPPELFFYVKFPDLSKSYRLGMSGSGWRWFPDMTFACDIPDNYIGTHVLIDVYDYDSLTSSDRYQISGDCQYYAGNDPYTQVIFLIQTNEWYDDDNCRQGYTDSNGAGHTSGSEQSGGPDAEVYFDIFTTDNDGDYLTYYEEVFKYNSNPKVKDIDTDGDKLPDWWEDKYFFDRLKAYPNDDSIDNDGINNTEEFWTGKSAPYDLTTGTFINPITYHSYGGNPLSKEIYVEIDWMTGHSFSTFGQTEVIQRFSAHEINLRIDDGCYGGGESITEQGVTAFYLKAGNNNDFWDYKWGNSWDLNSNVSLDENEGFSGKFSKNRLGIFRYCFFAADAEILDEDGGTSTHLGVSEKSHGKIFKDIIYDDFIIGDSNLIKDIIDIITTIFINLPEGVPYCPISNYEISQAAIFMHELGHNFDLGFYGGYHPLNTDEGYLLGSHISCMNYYYIFSIIDYTTSEWDLVKNNLNLMEAY